MKTTVAEKLILAAIVLVLAGLVAGVTVSGITNEPDRVWQVEGTVVDYRLSMGGFGHPSVGTLYFEDGRIEYINPEEQDPAIIILGKRGVWYFEHWNTLGTRAYKVEYDDLGMVHER